MTAINSPFRYPGGKFYARKLILVHIPNHNCYIEPMCGGASIYFAKTKAKRNILNDIDAELINCLIHIRDKPERIADLTENIRPTKENHNYFKNIFQPKTNIERAARWFFLNRTSYSGIMKIDNCYFGYGDKYSMRPENWRRHLIKTSEKLQGVELYSKDFKEIIKLAPDNSFLFIDPPYYNRDQDKFYSYSFDKNQHKQLSKLLKKHSKRLNFLITYDNVNDIKEMYQWTNSIMDKEWNYMIYRTDDQTKDANGGVYKRNGNKRYKGKEIFILNYDSRQQITLKNY